MTAKLVRWLLGSRRYFVPPTHADEAAALLVSSGAYFRRLRGGEKGLTFHLVRSDCKKVEKFFSEHRIEYEILRESGLYFLAEKYRKRYGILIGAFLFAAIIILSEQFIWTVNISGNGSIPEKVVEERLRELGCGVGTYIKGIDFTALHNEYLLRFDDTAWIAVNMHGTVANVEMIERKSPEKAADESVPYNLVAREDGIIEYMEILRGQPVARENELVRRGELLASGIEETKFGFRLVHARGKVLATVKRNIKIEVPLNEMQLAETGRVYTEKYLSIFGLSAKIFESPGNIPEEYDKIEVDRKISILGVAELPIRIFERQYRELCPVEVSYTPEEAKAEAYRRLRVETAEILAEGELAAREISAGLIGEAYVIECELSVICDVAEKLPIYTHRSQ